MTSTNRDWSLNDDLLTCNPERSPYDGGDARRQPQMYGHELGSTNARRSFHSRSLTEQIAQQRARLARETRSPWSETGGTTHKSSTEGKDAGTNVQSWQDLSGYPKHEDDGVSGYQAPSRVQFDKSMYHADHPLSESPIERGTAFPWKDNLANLSGATKDYEIPYRHERQSQHHPWSASSPMSRAPQIEDAQWRPRGAVKVASAHLTDISDDEDSSRASHRTYFSSHHAKPSVTSPTTISDNRGATGWEEDDEGKRQSIWTHDADVASIYEEESFTASALARELASLTQVPLGTEKELLSAENASHELSQLLRVFAIAMKSAAQSDLQKRAALFVYFHRL